MQQETSSLLTKGSNPGPHVSAVGADFDSYILRQINEEYQAHKLRQQESTPGIAQGSPSAAPRRPVNQRTLQDFSYDDVNVKKRRFTVNWDFTLNEAAADLSRTVVKVDKSDWPSFQMKPAGTQNAPVHDQKRQGALDSLVFKRLTVKQVQTDSVDPLALCIKGIKGNNYVIGSGVRTPFTLNPGSNAYGVNEVIHELDESLMKMADLRYTKMSREYLQAQAIPLPGDPDMCSVPVNSDITDVLRQQKSDLIPKLSDIPVFAEGTHFVLHTKLANKCIDMLLAKRGNVTLPTTNIYDLELSLTKANGEKWDNTNVAKRMSDKTGLVGQDLLDLTISTTLVIEAEYFLISENWDQKRTTPSQ